MFAFRKTDPVKRSLRPLERLHHVAGVALPLTVVENARATRLTLRIASGGQSLRITTPPGLPLREVDRFLARQHDWLEERLAQSPRNARVRPGVKVPIRGVPHRIVHVPEPRGLTKAGMVDDQPVLFVYGDRAHLPRRVADYMKRRAKASIEPLVLKHAAAIGRRAKSVRYKDTSSRWGSCSSAGNLSFSWRIVMAPPAVIDYLVAHEVAHLREMNHGVKFWTLCARLAPQTEVCRAWLKKNGAALQAIRFE